MKKRVAALLLSVCMLSHLLYPLSSVAESEALDTAAETEMQQTQITETVPVSLTESAVELTEDEASFYVQVTEALQDNDVNNVSRSEGDTMSVYSMDEDGTLREFVFNTDQNAPIMLESYSEIVLPINDSENIPMSLAESAEEGDTEATLQDQELFIDSEETESVETLEVYETDSAYQTEELNQEADESITVSVIESEDPNESMTEASDVPQETEMIAEDIDLEENVSMNQDEENGSDLIAESAEMPSEPNVDLEETDTVENSPEEPPVSFDAENENAVLVDPEEEALEETTEEDQLSAMSDDLEDEGLSNAVDGSDELRVEAADESEGQFSESTTTEMVSASNGEQPELTLSSENNSSAQTEASADEVQVIEADEADQDSQTESVSVDENAATGFTTEQPEALSAGDEADNTEGMQETESGTETVIQDGTNLLMSMNDNGQEELQEPVEEKNDSSSSEDSSEVNGTEPVENTYTSSAPVTVTAEQLLELIQKGDEMAIAFAETLGFGTKTADQIDNLTKIVDEYKAHPDYVEPAFVIDNVSISLDQDISEGTQSGYKTTISVDSTAEVSIVYDERGDAKVTRRVPAENPTDFIITLDVSGSMMSGGRDKAMFSALEVLLEQILNDPENTASIIFWANNAALMRIDLDRDGIVETTFSGEEGHTAENVYGSILYNTDQKPASPETSLSDYSTLSSGEIIRRIENIYGTGGSTEPDKGLDQAIALLNVMNRDEDRNLGVLLFTDGAANSGSNERATVARELELAEQCGAKIVNVSIGSETQVNSYKRYLDPTSPSYSAPDQEILKERVLYYNIPNVTNEELAARVTEMFDVAFEEFTTETVALKSETITTSILAAIEAKVIETVPAGFEVVSDGLHYTVEGTDENGNTVISFKLDDLIAGEGKKVSYFTVPTEGSNDMGITAYSEASGTALYVEPVDKILEADRGVEVVYQSQNNSEDLTQTPASIVIIPKNPKMPKNMESYKGNDLGHISAADEKRLVKNFRRKMQDAGIGNNIINDCVNKLDNTIDERMKEMWLAMFADISLLDVRTEEEGSYSGVEKSGQLYVNLDKSKIFTFTSSTVFHEVGHAVDRFAGSRLSQDKRPLFTMGKEEGIVSDVKDHVRLQAEYQVEKYITGLRNAWWFWKDEAKIEWFTQNKEIIIQYCTEAIMTSALPHFINGEKQTQDNYNLNLKNSFFSDTQYSEDINSIGNSIIADFKQRRDDLIHCTGFIDGTDWKDAYQKCISDVYGGVTNNVLDDGCRHAPDEDGSYWYNEKDGHMMGSRITTEPWAEYTEAKLENMISTMDVVNEFLPSYEFRKTEDEIYNIMMRFYDEHGIDDIDALLVA